MSANPKTSRSGPVRPSGLNHLVINVRDMDESHEFWSDIIGFTQVGEIKDRPGLKMRFYSGDHDGKLNHHDIALVEDSSLPKPTEEWTMGVKGLAINHIAVTLPSREAWLAQLEY
nr:VOC family protein [Gammaproteobacteria bacterium]